MREGVDRLLADERGGPVTDVTPVAGGSVNHAARLGDGRGGSWFLKWHRDAPPDLFAAEADGLRALRAAGALRVPEVWGWDDGGDVSWLLLEDVEPGPPAADHGRRLGRGLAALHARGDPDAGPGWHRDNWIGSLEQANGGAPTWSAFWRDRRIVPQLEAARRRRHLQDAGVLDRVVDRIPGLLADVDDRGHSLLHGDLWSGNAYADASGAPVIVDPAVYRGHGEVDLAMTELFGGFGRDFYDAYAEAAGLDEGYRPARRPLYQLYYLLVHVNLFGAGYVGRTLAAARAAAGAAG